METLGQFLKREREFRNISLEKVSQTTKISKRFLEYIEQDQWDDLPKGAFIKGFLKGNARQVGIAEEEIYRRYQAQSPQKKGEDVLRGIKRLEVKNRFFLILILSVVLVIVAAYVFL